MTKTQTERLAVIETKVENIQQEVAEIKSLLKSHVEWESNKYDSMKNEYAGKWVEKISIAVAGSVLTAILVGVVYLL